MDSEKDVPGFVSWSGKEGRKPEIPRVGTGDLREAISGLIESVEESSPVVLMMSREDAAKVRDLLGQRWVEGPPLLPGAYWVNWGTLSTPDLDLLLVEGPPHSPSWKVFGSDDDFRSSVPKITHHMRIPVPEPPVTSS